MSDNPNGASYIYLSDPEIRFLEAAVEHLIPTDELGPGARDAGVVVYIDRQLAGTWGVHGRQYRSGPWMEGTPEQGYQSRFTPQEVYRVAIREIDQHCRAAFDRPFAQLKGEQQLLVLNELEADQIALPSLSSKFFFDLLWRNTEEGYFADPLYGGNRDKVGWKLLGFPGVPSSAYRHLITSHEPYQAEPVSVLDIQTGKAPVDAEGFPKHVIIKRSRTI
ncbi:MAG: gluconate 2-dehydrogenase subunit 3 family protein [Acetobacteraceae bacterium]